MSLSNPITTGYGIQWSHAGFPLGVLGHGLPTTDILERLAGDPLSFPVLSTTIGPDSSQTVGFGYPSLKPIFPAY